VSSILNKIVIN